MTAEYTIRLRLDFPVSPSVLAQELAEHIAPLVARRKTCGDVVIGQLEGDWVLELPA